MHILPEPPVLILHSVSSHDAIRELSFLLSGPQTEVCWLAEILNLTHAAYEEPVTRSVNGRSASAPEAPRTRVIKQGITQDMSRTASVLSGKNHNMITKHAVGNGSEQIWT